MNGTTKAGVYTLKKAGFDNQEIKKIRDAVFVALGEAINKFGDAEDATPDDNNFSGWRIDINHPAAGGVLVIRKSRNL
jgi:hypothetical protein